MVGLPIDAARRELRDEGLLESALARPIQAAHYATANLAEQAATLLWGLAEVSRSSMATRGSLSS